MIITMGWTKDDRREETSIVPQDLGDAIADCRHLMGEGARDVYLILKSRNYKFILKPGVTDGTWHEVRYDRNADRSQHPDNDRTSGISDILPFDPIGLEVASRRLFGTRSGSE